MFGKRMKLFKLLGFEVHVDFSWIIIALLVAWSLSTGLFPFQFRGLSPGMYWLMGTIAAIGLFLSIIIHEFSHSLVARKQGMEMKGITLFIFGGVAEMTTEPPGPKEEFLMAIVGPLSSLVLALVFYALNAMSGLVGLPVPVTGVLGYLAFINVLLAIFNLIPAFPLDGGRALRSVLWRLKGNLKWATRVSSALGIFFAFLLIGYGFLRLFSGNLIGGMWMILIGMFLQNAASTSYRQMLIRKALEGEPVRRFMEPVPASISPSASLEQLVDVYVDHHHKVVPVTESGELRGCVYVQQVKEVPREEWSVRNVGELARPCNEENTIDPQTDASELLSRMNRTGSTRFMVVEGDRLVGSVSMDTVLKSALARMEIQE